jgi:hypothetical protein
MALPVACRAHRPCFAGRGVDQPISLEALCISASRVVVETGEHDRASTALVPVDRRNRIGELAG